MLSGTTALEQESSTDPYTNTIKGITGVKLKLRLAGTRVLSEEQDSKTLGRPFLYVNITATAEAANLDVELCQDAVLVRNLQQTPSVTTWSKGLVVQNEGAEPHSQ
jgi:hypothetical protein